MNIFNNITRGGQLQIHQLRLFQQIFYFAFLISLIISVSIFTYFIKQDISEIQAKRAIGVVKAKILLSIDESLGKKEIKQTIDNDEYNSTDIIRNPTYILSYVLVRNTIKSRAKEAAIYFPSSFILILCIWFAYGKNHKKIGIIKGKNLILPIELKAQLSKLKLASDLKIADLPLVKNRETQHIMVAGTTGSGKSNLFNSLLPQIKKRPNKAIIVDVTGEYIAEFYNPETDFIFNPLDTRSVNWDIWRDCHLDSHYESFAASIIPNKKYQSDDIWDASSRIVLVEVMKKLVLQNEKSISKLMSIINHGKIKELETFLLGTNAAKIITTAADKTTLSVLMNLTTQITQLKLLVDNDNGFSMRDWVANANPDSWLFISSRSDQIDSMRPLISTITDIALNALLSLNPDPDRRVWFVMDELAKLNNLSSLSSALAESRKYGGCIMVGIQSIAQLTENYGHASAQGIVDMFNSFFFFRCQNPQTNEIIAKILGVVEQEELHEQLSYGANVMRDGVSFSKQTKSKQLVLPIEIANLPDLECYVKYAGYDVTKIKSKYQDLPKLQPGFVLKKSTLEKL